MPAPRYRRSEPKPSLSTRAVRGAVLGGAAALLIGAGAYSAYRALPMSGRPHTSEVVSRSAAVSPAAREAQERQILSNQSAVDSQIRAKYSSEFEGIYSHYGLEKRQQAAVERFASEHGILLIDLLRTLKLNPNDAAAVKANLGGVRIEGGSANDSARIAYVLAGVQADPAAAEAHRRIRAHVLSEKEQDQHGPIVSLHNEIVAGETPEAARLRAQYYSARNGFAQLVGGRLLATHQIELKNGSYVLVEK